MPRPPRIWFPEALYHLTSRGNNREPIFHAAADYAKYLKLLREGLRRYDAQLWAYALMTNHVHLMVRTGHTHPVSKLMQFMNATYAMYVNRTYRRVGHTFQGRFHSVLVDQDSYALELTRYIHLNPVRAGLARSPERYAWSSYRAYLGQGAEALVVTKPILEMISPVEGQQPQRYADFVSDRLAMASMDRLERQLKANQILGSPEFVLEARKGARAPARKPPESVLGV